jgi:hypothetical protein
MIFVGTGYIPSGILTIRHALNIFYANLAQNHLLPLPTLVVLLILPFAPLPRAKPPVDVTTGYHQSDNAQSELEQ